MSISLQAELGDIVYVELPEVGSEVKQGEQFGVIESVKVSHCPCHIFSWTAIRPVRMCLSCILSTSAAMQAASDVNSPVSGEVTAVNDSLTDDSAKVSTVFSEGSKLPHVSMHQQICQEVAACHIIPSHACAYTIGQMQ